MSDQTPVGDDTLKTQREKFDQYRQWMRQQQETLSTTGAATAEMAKRLDGTGAAAANNHAAQDIVAQESAYARRHGNRRGKSPPNGGAPGAAGAGAGGNNAQMSGSVRSGGGGGYSPFRGGSPPSPYNKQGHVVHSSPPGAPRPSWINTKVGSTNQKSQIPNEQLAKFIPPPPPSDDGSGYHNDPLNVYSRSQLWQRRKHQKLSEAREIKEQVMDMECTFTPQTRADQYLSQSRHVSEGEDGQQQQRGHSATSAGRGGEHSAARSQSLTDSKQYGGGFHVTGVEDFIARQNKAREDAAFREQRLKTRPQFAWKNATTAAEPFELGRRRQSTGVIKSLRQPFTAAPGAVQQAMRQAAHLPSPNNVFAALDGVLPRGVFSGVTAAEIVDSAVLRSGASHNQSAARQF